MTWQAYVDTNLVDTGKISRAAIIGLGKDVWATSPGYNLTPDERGAIVEGLKDPSQVQSHGIRANGQKFFFVKGEVGRSIYGKKQADGIIIVKTGKAVLVAEYVGPTQAPEATPIVEGLADYLIGAGY